MSYVGNLFRKWGSGRKMVGESSQDQTEELTIFSVTELGDNPLWVFFCCVQGCGKW